MFIKIKLHFPDTVLYFSPLNININFVINSTKYVMITLLFWDVFLVICEDCFFHDAADSLT
jgi:hypothetical protein